MRRVHVVRTPGSIYPAFGIGGGPVPAMNEQLLTKIRQCPTLPSLPAIAIEVLNLAQRDEVDIAEIARTISRDPALSGKILRTVNSSFYGRSQSVSNLSQALVILGLLLLQVALGISNVLFHFPLAVAVAHNIGGALLLLSLVTLLHRLHTLERR